MAIRCQQLQRLQSDRGSHDNEDDKHQAAGVGESERQSHQRKCREMFKMRTGNYRTIAYRRQRRVDDESQCQPASNIGNPLDHRL